MVLVHPWIDQCPKLNETGVEGLEAQIAGKNLKSSGNSRMKHVWNI